MNPYKPPDANLSRPTPVTEYVGFWPRVFASIVDSVITAVATLPLLYSLYGDEYFVAERMLLGPAELVISYLLPAIAIIVFWVYKGATPGKMAIGARIVDGRTGERATTGQLIGRYFGYFVSFLPLGLGCLWVIWDPRHQGWHDKLANTVVVRQSSLPRNQAGFEA